MTAGGMLGVWGQHEPTTEPADQSTLPYVVVEHLVYEDQCPKVMGRGTHNHHVQFTPASCDTPSWLSFVSSFVAHSSSSSDTKAEV